MSNKLQLAMRIKNLKTTKGFTVPCETDRKEVCKTAKNLRDAGVITFDVVTKADGNGGFKVAAI